MQTEDEHCQTVDAETETAVRGTTVLEEFKVEFYVFAQAFFVRLFFKNVVSVFTLSARGDFYAAPDEVVALRNAVFVAHVVERTFFAAVIGDEQKLVIVVFFNPFVA